MYIRPCDSMQNCFFLSFFPFFFFFFIFSILLYYLFSYIPSFIFSPTNLPIHTNLFDRFLFFILTFLSSQPRPEKLDSKTYSGIFFCAAPIEREPTSHFIQPSPLSLHHFSHDIFRHHSLSSLRSNYKFRYDCNVK